MIEITITQDGETTVALRPSGYLQREDFQTYLSGVKSTGAKFDGNRKLHLLPRPKVADSIELLRRAGFGLRIQATVAGWLAQDAARATQERAGAVARAAEVDGRLRARGKALYPFQRVGAEWLAPRPIALLCDEPGLGKTVQSLAATGCDVPILVIGPSVAKGVWLRETKAWRPDLTPQVLAGRTSFRWPKPGEIVITNYDILPPEDTSKKSSGPMPGTILIADEAHAVKSYKALRTKRFRVLADKVHKIGGKIWLVTATPILNRPMELWTLLKTAGLAREVFGRPGMTEWNSFLAYFHASPGHWGGYEFGRPDPEVAERLSRYMLRRRFDDVLPELPKQRTEITTVEIDAKTRRLCDDTLRRLTAGGLTLEEAIERALSGGLEFEELSRVRQALAVAKLPAAEAMVDDLEAAEEKVVVFSHHRLPVETLGAREGWASIVGGMPAAQRTEIEEQFQRGELRGLACTIEAGGVSITLTRAARAIFVDRSWTPSKNKQAAGRLRRIGQDRPTLVTVLAADHVVDERLEELLQAKEELIDDVVEAASSTGGPVEMRTGAEKLTEGWGM